MNTLLRHFFSMALVFTFFSCSNDDTASTETITDPLDPRLNYEALDISYGTDARQTFDLYLPANRSENTKVLILVHGGSWISGDKEDMNPIKDLISTDLPNYAIANLSYRLADANNSPYPMQIDDITSVVNYLADNQEKYNISDTIGFIGLSSGAHLSLLWSYAFDVNNQVDMVCSVVGPTNFTDPAYLNSTSIEVQLLLQLFGANDDTALLEEMSPLHQLTAQAPPTILFYGGEDPLIPTTQGTGLRDKLESLGVQHEFTLYEEAGHGWLSGAEIIDTWTKLKNFINNHL